MYSLNVTAFTGVLLFTSKVGPCEAVWLKIALLGRVDRLSYRVLQAFNTMEVGLREALGLPCGSLFSGSSPTFSILEEYDGCSVADGLGLGQSSLLGQRAHAVGLSAIRFSFCVKFCCESRVVFARRLILIGFGQPVLFA